MVSFLWQGRDSMSTIKVILEYGGDNEESISLYYDNEKYYAFLPSFADLTHTHVVSTSGYRVEIDGRQYDSQTPLNDLNAETEYSLRVSNSLDMTQTQQTIVFYQTKNIPSMHLRLSDGTIEDINQSVDKSISKSGVCNIIEPDGQTDFYGAFERLKGRGQFSWKMDKKSYNLFFQTEQNLLGMGEAVKYCLIANATDYSDLRNKIIYDTTMKLGMKNAVSSEYVDLYIDGEYMGLYLLTESVDIERNRIHLRDLASFTAQENFFPLAQYDDIQGTAGSMEYKAKDIPDNPSDITGGYLLETTEHGRIAQSGGGFTTAQGNDYILKFPEYLTEKQAVYIGSLMTQIENHASDESVTQMLDLDSCVKCYLIQEFFENLDTCSFFFYKDSDTINSKMYAGPVWDMDMSFGSNMLFKQANVNAFTVNTWGIYRLLYQNPAFLKEVKRQYAELLKPILTDLTENGLQHYEEQVACSYAMDCQRWVHSAELSFCPNFDTLHEHVMFFSDFIRNRKHFVENEWVDNKPYCTMVFTNTHDGLMMYYYSLEKGQTPGAQNMPAIEDADFIGWYDDKTGECFDPNAPVTESHDYTARWNVKEIEAFDEKTEQTGMRATIRFLLSGENKYVTAGFGIIMIALGAFIISDIIHVVKSRRKRHGKKR